MEEACYCPLASFSLCVESCMTTGCLLEIPWWQWVCSHVKGWFFNYQGGIFEFSLEAEGIFLNSLDWLVHWLISLGYNPFRFTALFQGGGSPERLICHISSHCKSKAAPYWETPKAKGRGHLAAWLPEISGAAWQLLEKSYCFSRKGKSPHCKMTWHVIAKDKPEDLKGHDNTSTASVAVPKCGSSKPAVWPPVIQQTNLRMPWVPNAEPRRMASGLNPCPGTFRTPPEVQSWRTGPF